MRNLAQHPRDLSLVIRLLVLTSALLVLGMIARAHATSPTAIPTSDYQLGIGDEINIWVTQVPDLSAKTVTIDRAGGFTLPLVGRIRADGLTASQLEVQIREALKVYVHQPDVGVSVVQAKNEGVSITGAVSHPGVYQLTGGGRLLDMLVAAGGLSQNAGPYAEVMRPLSTGPLPLPDARTEATGKNSVARVNVRAITGLEKNFVLKAGDTVAIPEAQMVYVIGEVNKPGAYPITDTQQMTALQVIAMAGGPLKTAAPAATKLLRQTPGAKQPTMLTVNLNQVLKGKGPSIEILPNDILFIPDSKQKAATARALDALIQTGLFALTYGVIYK